MGGAALFVKVPFLSGQDEALYGRDTRLDEEGICPALGANANQLLYCSQVGLYETIEVKGEPGLGTVQDGTL